MLKEARAVFDNSLCFRSYNLLLVARISNAKVIDRRGTPDSKDFRAKH